MTEIILKDIPDNYFDVFSSDLYQNSQEREVLNVQLVNEQLVQIELDQNLAANVGHNEVNVLQLLLDL